MKLVVEILVVAIIIQMKPVWLSILTGRQLEVNPPATTPGLMVNPTQSPGPGPTQNPSPGANNPLQPGSSVILRPGDIYRVSSTNFGVGYATAGEVSTWQFQASQCLLNATCPCVDIGPSWNCVEGYLKLKTGIVYDVQKFCGGHKPTNFTSDSGSLTIRYRANAMRLSTGFTCFVTCTGFGQNAAALPYVNCPGPY